MTDKATSNRRGFFRNALSKAIGPLAGFIEEKFPSTAVGSRLRSPGAIAEDLLLATCYRCGACADACPADAIFALDPSHGVAAGTPVIDPDRAPCVVCDGLQCTKVCSSGALIELTEARQIRMGLAEVYGPLCVRQADEACSLCVDRCPMGEAALFFPNEGPPVVRSDCVGCGVCQQVCPTSPKAIVVRPR